MATLKAIETKYNGYRFRSRLEARWAVFFDKLGIKYEYELEGYELPSGKRYLPDFLLPGFDLHVEIKPTEKLSYEDLQKITDFAVEEDNLLLLIVGTPTNERMYLINRVTTPRLDELEGDYEGDTDAISTVFFELLEDWGNVTFGGIPLSRGWTLAYKAPTPYEDCHLKEALLKAKQARFEFGESG